MAQNPPDTRYNFDELCTLVDLPRRTVRYYIQIGLVDRPEGSTRAAFYSQRHLDQLLQVRQWTQAGISLERVRELLNGAPPMVPMRPRGPGTVEVWSHLTIADGIELMIEPGRAGLAPETVRELFVRVGHLYAELTEKEKNDGND